MTSTPYTIPIQVNGTLNSGITVKLKNESTGEILSQTTDSDGRCIFNLSNLNLGWTSGDFLEFNASGTATSPSGKVLKFKAKCISGSAQIEEIDIDYEI